MLTKAQRDHEERKARYLGRLFSAVAAREDISPSHANFLIEVAGRLTWQQFVLLTVVHETGYRQLPEWRAVHPFDSRAHSLMGQFFDLAQQGILFRTDSAPVREYSDVDPSYLRVGTTGCILIELMRLDEIEPEELGEAIDELRAVADEPTPIELRSRLDNSADALRLTEDDLGEGRIRIPFWEGDGEQLVPPDGSEPAVMLGNSPLSFRFKKLETEGHFVCLPEHLEEFQARVELDQVLRLSKAHDGVYWFD